MTSFQKIIKYVAIAFAIYLTLMIIGAIVFGITVVCGIGLGMERFESSDNTEVIARWEHEYTNIKDIDIDIGVGKLTIKKGDTLKVQAFDISDQFVCEAEKGKLQIEDKKVKRNFWGMSNTSAEVVITLPEELVLDEVTIEAGINDTTIEHLKAKKVKLNGGVGKVVIKSEIMEKADIKCGIGKLELALIGVPENYKIEAQTGLGRLKVEDQTITNHQVIGSGDAIVAIEAGIGETVVTFEGGKI